MTKEKIAKKIKHYTRNKIIIVSLLLISTVSMCSLVILNLFIKANWITYGAIISYLFMFVMIIAACRFNLNEPLTKAITINEYKEILKYMSEISDNISTQVYYDGLLMIKRTLDNMVYYYINRMNDDIFRQNLCYLQSVFLSDNNIRLISSKVLNKTYLKGISKLLYEQIENGKFDISELQNYDVKNLKIKKQFHVSEKMFTNILNVILILIVIIKIAITINVEWYNNINNYPFWRIIYNTSIDFIAASFAVITISKNK